MAEIWGAAIVVGGSIISGIASEKKAKSDQKHSDKMTELDYEKTAQQTGYEAALQDFYKQKDDYDKQRGLDLFRNFSTIQNFSPDSAKYDGILTAPVMPQYKDYQVTPDAPASSGGGGGSGGTIIEKLDPLGSKLFGGLF